MTKVYAPNKQYTGLSANVMFINGVGETDDPHLLAWFESKGYTVEHSEPEAEQVPQELEKPADDLPQEPEAPETEPQKPTKKGK
ncbi:MULTISPECIES: hypothetical protein [Paenibacillus]|uniref:Uncharacterized protein n=1 Tax=Paenibacillus lautus TaxID=1401 RepID=A0A1R1ALU8_PAELA|nr:hypothetical protein [Paenibacillus lautus]OME86524.1 hypothetical protein BK123_32500 [Paenibacillus lautus]